MLLQQWSDELASVAQAYAEQCIFDHNSERVGQQGTFASVGENLASSSPATEIGNTDLQSLVTNWDNEKNDYDYDSNSCGSVCGHYTQVK